MAWRSRIILMKSKNMTYLLWGGFLLLAAYALFNKNGSISIPTGFNWLPIAQANNQGQ